MNSITFDQYLSFQMQAAAVAHGNIPEAIANNAKLVVDKVLELNNTRVVQFESATELFKRSELFEKKE
jgi:hypothetical protein